MNVLLGIDIGTSGTKTLAIDEKGKILASASATYELYHPRPLWSEQDPEDWWQAVVKTVRSVVKQAKLKPDQVRAIGLSGQMHGSVFLDKQQRVIRRALLWNDQRTAAECEEIEKRAGGRDALIQMVANPALTGFTAPKVLWLRNHEPRNFAKTRHVLLPKDEIRRRLTGELASEMSDASGTLLLDVKNRRWSTELLGKLELDESLLPSLYESEQVTGKLTADAAAALGLSTSCVVVGGAGDCAAGAVGNGIVNTGVLSTSIGTSGVMFVHTDTMKFDPAGRLHTFCHAVNGQWHMMGVTLASGASLEWFRSVLFPPELVKGKKKVDESFATLEAEATKVVAGCQGLYFLPYLAGERTPHADPHARGCFVGLTMSHTRGHMVRAILEGVTYSLRDSLEIIRGLDVPVRQIRASGGGSKSPLWRQIQADVFGQKIVSLNAEEGPAFGVALLAAVGAGCYRDIREACRATIRPVDETPTRRAERLEYDRRFGEYQQLYRSLKPDFHTIAQLEGNA